ncbi:MAG: AAA family ATPase [Actinomycetota bacterium]|nr:AAA family ATPase [Actinomycetota bacterium]
MAAREPAIPTNLTKDNEGVAVSPGALLREQLLAFTEEFTDDSSPAAPAISEPQPLELDFSAPPEAPCYLVHGLISRGGLALLSGDTGSGKTWMVHDLVRAIATGSSWLGRPTVLGKVLCVDEENPPVLVRRRLMALGLPQEATDRVLYFVRNGIAVGEPEWNAWLERKIQEHGADAVFIDSAVAATAVSDINDNTAVARLLTGLRAIAERQNCTIHLIHHERKVQKDAPRSAGMSAMGARQWVAQADVHLAVRRLDNEEELDPDGRIIGRTGVLLEMPKDRDGLPIRPERLVIESLRDENGRMLRAELRSEGPQAERSSEADNLLKQVVELLTTQGPLSRKRLSEALGRDRKDGTLDRALREGRDTGVLTLPERGVYAATDNHERGSDTEVPI